MTSLSESLVASDPSKSAFLEFSHGYQSHQQHSPGVSHAHYPVHGLHQGAHSQYDAAFSSGAASYGRPLTYHYPSAHHHPGAYLPYQHNSAVGHSRVDDAGKVCFPSPTDSKKSIAKFRAALGFEKFSYSLVQSAAFLNNNKTK